MDFSIASFFCACSLAVAMNSYREQYEFLFVNFFVQSFVEIEKVIIFVAK